MSNGATQFKFPKESGKKRGPDISWRSSQEAEYPNSQKLTNSQDVVQPTITYSAKELQELNESIDARRRKNDPEWPGNRTAYPSKFGKSKSSVRLDPKKDVAKKRRFESPEEVKTFIGEIILDLIKLINSPEHMDEKGLDVQIQADVETVSNYLILLHDKLIKEGHTNEQILSLFEEIIKPLHLDPKSNQVYEVLSTFLKEHFNAETPAPAGGSKSAKKRFKTQKKGKDKSAGKSVRRRRRKGTKKLKSNKKRATKRSRK
jgi:hypothetical protein